MGNQWEQTNSDLRKGRIAGSHSEQREISAEIGPEIWKKVGRSFAPDNRSKTGEKATRATEQKVGNGLPPQNRRKTAVKRHTRRVKKSDRNPSVRTPKKAPEKRGRHKRKKVDRVDGMLRRQRTFLLEKLVGLNDKEAALAAGYAPSVATNTKHKIWAQPGVAAEFERLKQLCAETMAECGKNACTS